MLKVTFTFRSLVLVLLLGGVMSAYPQAKRVIFDTDMGNDIDDALALAMIHSLESRGEAELLAVTLTKDNRWAAPYVDIVNTFYGRGSIPIGAVKGGKTPEDSQMVRVPAQRRGADGRLTYPHDLVDGSSAPDAVYLLRSLLAKQEDGSVSIIQVGFSTNLARLLTTRGDSHSPLDGKELVRRKVGLLSVMAGAFPAGNPEYNVKMDVESAKRLFAEWPTPIVISGYEVGESLLYPARSIEKHYRYVDAHPIADAYRNYMKMPYDRPTWDLSSVLYAIRPDEGYFELSASGRVIVGDDGKTHLEPSEGGPHRYLVVNEKQRQRILEAMIQLSSEPPCTSRR